MRKKIAILFSFILILTSTSFCFAQTNEVAIEDWISISGNIDRIKAEEVILTLINFDSKPTTAPIGIRIFSPGGSLMSIMAICDVMKNLRRPVVTVALGEAFSGGAIILSTGNQRFIGKHTMVMLHQPAVTLERWSSSFQDFREFSTVLNKIEKQVYNLLAQNTGKSTEEIRHALEKDLWLTAEEAIDFGLADKILTEGVLRMKTREDTLAPPPAEEQGDNDGEAPPSLPFS